MVPHGPPSFSPNAAIGRFPPTGAGTVTDYRKLRATFKLPMFTGLSLEFKPYMKSLDRYASIQGLDMVMTAGYPTSALFCFETNKLFYYIFQESVSQSSKATKFFNTAAKWDGHGAYLCVYNGYTFIGATTATILLGQLANLRIEADETVTEFVLRLQVLFEDLENVPGDASYVFNDVQRIGYLLQTIRHESDLAHQHTYIQTAASRNAITFDAACNDLIVRDDNLRSDLLQDTSSRPRKTLAATPQAAESDHKPRAALITANAKKSGNPRGNGEAVQTFCLVDGCDKPRTRGLCRRHYMEITSGKVASFLLINGWGQATFTVAQGIVFPDAVPKDRKVTGVYKPRSPDT